MSYQHLTYEKRYTISTLRRNGSKPSHIAQQLGRHVSTINRELRRNATLEGGRSISIRALVGTATFPSDREMLCRVVGLRGDSIGHDENDVGLVCR